MGKAIGEAMDMDQRQTQLSPWSAPPCRPSGKTVEIIGKLGLRYPPANTVDREAHAARIALLAEDCADLDPRWLEAAAREWVKRSPFLPKACELRSEAIAIVRLETRGRALPAPRVETPAPPPAPPLTEAEIAKLPPWLLSLGRKVGEIE